MNRIREVKMVKDELSGRLDLTYLSSSSDSNFLGFLGQHSHMYAPWI